MSDKYPVGFTFTVVDEDESRTYKITKHWMQNVTAYLRHEPPEFDYVVRDESRTSYLVTHGFVQACLEASAGSLDE